ncbi:unnamed protein product [Rotaria socialis]|uniref:VWFA domain-containing protein n=2 Tax=Rotaria socialis TaxID=392032 RepID=A0A818PXA1_9BILA|nr:unnamed protein product [Rotaria socialis]CAF3632225.1 unnamed protein product [Rotaria socialis]CAF4312815.1 unnamed protein product [Rotaria socialis]CAF4488534.1 unnamed protein product [Rotaria socialis]CAF4746761.1 unnamed protein product [Rotaria socialis]
MTLLTTEVKAENTRGYINPLNGKAVDLFIAVDESNAYMNSMQLGLMKTALNNIATELNPTGSNPFFGVYFYGATQAIDNVVPFKTGSAGSLKTYLEIKQYTKAQTSPSTLNMALGAVKQDCLTHCRPIVPRVTVVISNLPDYAARATIRQMEKDSGMTVIVVGIGSTATATIVNQLATYPAESYAIPVSTHYELIMASSHIGSTVSDVPRILNINNAVHIPTTTSGVYHTVQLNTHSYTTTNDMIIMFSSNCPTCSVFGSLSEHNPTRTNTVANTNRRSFFAYSGYPNSMHYFRVPKDTGRFFLSFLGNGMSGVYIWVDVFSLPNMLSSSTRIIQNMNLTKSNS